MDSLFILNGVLTLGVIAVAIAGGYAVWQSFHIDINTKSHKVHPSK
jgi:hypothetical protein